MDKLDYKSMLSQVVYPLLVKFASSDVWGVRKAMAENMPTFIKHSPALNFSNSLIECFGEDYLEDTSKFVRTAAYQNMGKVLEEAKNRKLKNTMLEDHMATLNDLILPDPRRKKAEKDARELG